KESFLDLPSPQTQARSQHDIDKQDVGHGLAAGARLFGCFYRSFIVLAGYHANILHPARSARCRCAYFLRPKSTVTTLEPSSLSRTGGSPSCSGESFSASSCGSGGIPAT